MSSSGPNRVFQLKLDPVTGNSEWVVIDDQDAADDEHEPSPPSSSGGPDQGLLATRSYLDMLNDSSRNRVFREAFDKSLKKPCRVIDIGAGTGLLSMTAARAMGFGEESVECGCDEGSVIDVELYLPMVKLMRHVLRQNGMGRIVGVLNKRWDEIEVGVDIKARADVLVSEMLDSESLSEGLIPTLQHAHDMLLVETTRFNLSEPLKIFEFEFWKPPQSHGKTTFNVKALSGGQLHVVISWWNLQLDKEGSIFYSTAPGWIASSDNSYVRNWCEHWRQCTWFVPERGLSCHADDDINFHAVHDATSISYFLEPDRSQMMGENCNFLPQDCITLSPERIAVYGKLVWQKPLRM